MIFITKQGQNLIPQSETCSGWTANNALLEVGAGSPWGRSFKLTDSANNAWHLATMNAITTGQNSGDLYGVRTLYKSVAVTSAAAALKINLSTNGSEYLQLTWSPMSPKVQPRPFNVGSCSFRDYRSYEVQSPWFAVEALIRRESSSHSLFQLQLFPAVGSVNALGSTASYTNMVEFSAVQLVRGGYCGPYVRTESGTSVVSGTLDYVELFPSAMSDGHGALARQHASGIGNMTRQVLGTFDMTKITDRFVQRRDALRIECWWRNNVAVSIFNGNTGAASSGFIINKASPIRGYTEPNYDQHEVVIELEGY